MARLPKDDHFDENLTSLDHLWVFGYGSILWKTGFTYKSMKYGCVPGYSRKFWQGSTTHRGTPSLPGRVATLVEDHEAEVWGVAYELEGTTMVQSALDHLGLRECSLGGYIAQMLPFQCRTDKPGCPTLTVLVFQATTTNEQYLGPASMQDIANQVVACKGSTGYNVEYVTRLADFIRAYIPEDNDQHLLELDHSVRALLHERNISLESRLSDLQNGENGPKLPPSSEPSEPHTHTGSRRVSLTDKVLRDHVEYAKSHLQTSHQGHTI